MIEVPGPAIKLVALLLSSFLIAVTTTATVEDLQQTTMAEIYFADLDVEITTTVVGFDPDQFYLSCRQGSVLTINGLPFFGSDGLIPQTRLETLIVGVNAKATAGRAHFPLDVSGMYNPWIELGDRFDLRPIGDGLLWELTGIFSDGAASYAATWRVSPKGALRTRLSDDTEWVNALIDSRFDPEKGHRAATITIRKQRPFHMAASDAMCAADRAPIP